MATDLDGTLLRADGTVSPRTRAVLAELEEQGVPVVFVTGRPLRWAWEVFEHVGEHGLAVLANGALVWQVAEHRVHLLRPVEPAVVREACHRIRQAVPGSAFAVETVAGIDLEPGFHERYPVPEGSRRAPVEDLLDAPVVKLLARHEELEPLSFWAAAQEAVGDLATVTWSSTSALLEISGAGVTKASTLGLLCAELGIAAEDVVAFGDMPNDLALLRWAGAGYAMADAHPLLREATPLVAPGHQEDGVAMVLERLFALETGERCGEMDP